MSYGSPAVFTDYMRLRRTSEDKFL